MVDINDDTKRVRGRVEIRTGVIRRRRWTAEEKGRIVAEAILPDAVIADVARRHDLAPQHLSNWIRAAKDGRFALPSGNEIAFVPVIAASPPHVDNAASSGQPACAKPELRFGKGRVAPIEIAVDCFVVRVPNGSDARTLEAVVRAVRRAAA
jgi:transposase